MNAGSYCVHIHMSVIIIQSLRTSQYMMWAELVGEGGEKGQREGDPDPWGVDCVC